MARGRRGKRKEQVRGGNESYLRMCTTTVAWWGRAHVADTAQHGDVFSALVHYRGIAIEEVGKPSRGQARVRRGQGIEQRLEGAHKEAQPEAQRRGIAPATKP